MALVKTLCDCLIAGDVCVDLSSLCHILRIGKLALDKSDRTDRESSASRDISLSDSSSRPFSSSSITSGVGVGFHVFGSTEFCIVISAGVLTWGIFCTRWIGGGGGIACELDVDWLSSLFLFLVVFRCRNFALATSF